MQKKITFLFSEKTLCELITPTEKRIEGVLDFLQDIKPCIEHKVVAINDMFGPTISDPHLQFIVVSEETKRGGEIVNEERQKKVDIYIHSCKMTILFYLSSVRII